MAEQKPRRRVTDLKVHEISLVDRPAVPKAEFLIVKRGKKGGRDMSQVEKTDVDIEEEIEKADAGAMDTARKAVDMMMDVRRGLPSTIRRLAMEMDMAMDEMNRAADEPEEEEKGAGAYGSPSGGSREEEEKGVHEEEEKRGTEEEEKGLKKPKKQKGEHQDCPPGMEWDPEKGKCVPKPENKKKQATEDEEEQTKGKPRRQEDDRGLGKGIEEEIDDLDLSEEEKVRVNSLVERLK